MPRVLFAMVEKLSVPSPNAAFTITFDTTNPGLSEST